jgi:hypothetical protein
MKKTIITIAAALTMTVSGYSQGNILFSNLGGGVVAPISDETGARIDGASGNHTVELLAMPKTGGSMTSIATTTFDTGNFAGFFAGRANPIDTGLAIDVGGSSHDWMVRVWDNTTGATYDLATVRGESALLTGVGPLTDNQSPNIPTLTGLQSFSLTVVPEPSVILLGLAGAGMLWFRRKK